MCPDRGERGIERERVREREGGRWGKKEMGVGPHWGEREKKGGEREREREREKARKTETEI